MRFVDVPDGGKVVDYREGVMAAVSVTEDADGTLRLIELEIIEPQLYLRWAPETADRFASAIAAASRST